MTNLQTATEDPASLAYDVRRSIILSSFISEWGFPVTWEPCRLATGCVEIYSFEPVQPQRVARVATVGVSSLVRADGKRLPYELMLALPHDLAGASVDDITVMLMNIVSAHFSGNFELTVDALANVSAFTPTTWSTTHIWIQEPLAEPETLTPWNINGQEVELLWLIPLFSSEATYICKNGTEAFDSIWYSHGSILSNPLRQPLV